MVVDGDELREADVVAFLGSLKAMIVTWEASPQARRYLGVPSPFGEQFLMMLGQARRLLNLPGPKDDQGE